jgi:hypothetical protein
MPSLLVFNKVYRLEIQSFMVFSAPISQIYPPSQGLRIWLQFFGLLLTHPGGPKLTDPPDRILNTVSSKLEHLKKELRVYHLGNISRVWKSKYVDKASSFDPKRAININQLILLLLPPLLTFYVSKLKTRDETILRYSGLKIYYSRYAGE